MDENLWRSPKRNALVFWMACASSLVLLPVIAILARSECPPPTGHGEVPRLLSADIIATARPLPLPDRANSRHWSSVASWNEGPLAEDLGDDSTSLLVTGLARDSGAAPITFCRLPPVK